MEERSKDFVTRQELNNYFKKSDYLSGLTSLEQLQLRKNVGILNYTNSQGDTNCVSITYAALYQLYLGNSLSVGAKYLITDYQTIYQSNVLVSGVYQTWTGNSYPLIVTASSNATIEPFVTITTHPKWTVKYDITKSTFADSSTNKGTITYLKDENNNSAFYDFKSIKNRRTVAQLASSNLVSASDLDLYTFSVVSGTTVSDNSSNSTVHSNEIKENCANNIFIGDTYNNVFETGCQGNTFLNGCHDSIIGWDSTNNFFNETVCYTTGAINAFTMAVGNTTFSSAITKQICKVDDATIVSYLDPTTYTYQVIIL